MLASSGACAAHRWMNRYTPNRVNGLPSLLASNVNRWGGLLAEELLEGAVVHTVDRAAIDQAARQGLRPGALKVTEGGVRVTLDPIRAQGA